MIEFTALGKTEQMTEDEVRATNIKTLIAFLDDDYVTEITIRSMGHGFQPSVYRKINPDPELDDHIKRMIKITYPLNLRDAGGGYKDPINFPNE